MDDAEGMTLLERLRALFDGGDGRAAGSEPELPRPPGEPTSDCGDVREVSCQEAVERVYEYLDGELEEERAEEIRCHVEQCKRCYPMYNWEQMFLDFIGDRAGRPEENPELRSKVEALLDREADGVDRSE